MHRVPSFCRIPRILMVSVWSTGFFYCSFVSEMVFLLLLNQFNGVFPVKELAACCRTLNSEKRDHRSLSLTLHIFYLYIYIYMDMYMCIYHPAFWLCSLFYTTSSSHQRCMPCQSPNTKYEATQQLWVAVGWRCWGWA